MATTLTNLKTATNVAGATLTVANLTVPATGMIIVGICEANTSVAGTLSDGVNTYSLITSVINNNSTVNGLTQFWYAKNAVLNAGAITYTKHASGASTAISACYASTMITPLVPLIASQIGSGTGSTMTASISCNTSNLLVVVQGFTRGTTLTLSSGFAMPPNTTGFTSAAVGGGWIVATTNTQLYSAHLATAIPWGIIAAEFTTVSSSFIQTKHYMQQMGVGR